MTHIFWLARTRLGTLMMFRVKPVRSKIGTWKISDEDMQEYKQKYSKEDAHIIHGTLYASPIYEIDSRLFEDVTWEEGPKQVILSTKL